MRQVFPDGSVWVRTQPIGFLGGVYRTGDHRHEWHQLTVAASGHLEVETENARAFVPRDRAVWIPAGLRHREVMHAPVEVRTLYVAPGAWPHAATRSRTLALSALLRELILHVCPLGALDRERRRDALLIDLLLALLAEADEVSLRLPMPRDPRARRLAELLRAQPGRRDDFDVLAREAGASRRTLERLFRSETGLSLGAWRQRIRLHHAHGLLADGHTVTEVADRVGYATASAFGAAFRGLFGHAPRDVRRRG